MGLQQGYEVRGNFPVFCMRKPVTHVGCLDEIKPASELAARVSHEAFGLSVSLHPDAWRRIARLSGHEYLLSKDNARWLNMHRTLGATDLMSEVMQWSNAQGLVVPAELFVVHFEDECGEACFSKFHSLDEAIYESAALGGEIEPVAGWMATQSLQLASRSPVPVAPLFVEEFAVLQFADKILNVDGAWWSDALDIGSYSAPRGCVFNVADWLIAKAPQQQISRTPLGFGV